MGDGQEPNIVESIIQAVQDAGVNPEQSETLAIYTSEVKTDRPVSIENQTTENQNNIARAPLRTPENDPNYKLWQEAFEKTGDENLLVKTELSPETISAAVGLLVQSPEFKDYIGQSALSNDLQKNIETLNQAINSQKNYTEDMTREVDGEFFNTKDAYFIQRIINGITQSDMADDFFNELRDKVNAEFTAKDDSKKTDTTLTPEEQEPDAFQKVAKLLEQREGTIVEDATTNEKIDELKRIFGTPEYKQAQIEEIGYDPEVGHPDLEIREYLKAKFEYAKQPYYDRGPEPKKPENYEQRLNQPKIDYDNRRELEGRTSALTPESTKRISLSEPFVMPKDEQTTSLFELPVNEQQTALIKDVEPNSMFSLQPGSTKDKDTLLTDVTSLLQPQNSKTENIDLFSSVISDNLKQFLSVETEPTSNETFTEAATLQDENSEQILANTEKTNTTLQSLTQLLAALVQSGVMSQTATESGPVPVPVPMSSGQSERGVTDLELASGTGMIPNIRANFNYFS